ncbi:MAG: uracil-DNA glycosylase [Bacteroidaceae bacterium]
MEKIIDKRWLSLLGDEFEKDYFQTLWTFVEAEYEGGVCYPPVESIFRAFNECSPEEVRVVILGQDPYHEEGQAEGLSFSVGSSDRGSVVSCDLFGNREETAGQGAVAIPPSLRNILREVVDDVGSTVVRSGSLLPWAREGVLLLNTVLTVRQGMANSHAGRGWEIFIDRVIGLVNERCDNVVFMLWGSPAARKSMLIDKERHLVLTSPHPSPLSAYRGFFGNRHFSRANEYLSAHGRGVVEW